DCKFVIVPGNVYVYEYETNLTTDREKPETAIIGLNIIFQVHANTENEIIIKITQANTTSHGPNPEFETSKIMLNDDENLDANTIFYPFGVISNGSKLSVVFSNNESAITQNVKKSIAAILDLKRAANKTDYKDGSNGLFGFSYDDYTVQEEPKNALVRIYRYRNIRSLYDNGKYYLDKSFHESGGKRTKGNIVTLETKEFLYILNENKKALDEVFTKEEISHYYKVFNQDHGPFGPTLISYQHLKLKSIAKIGNEDFKIFFDDKNETDVSATNAISSMKFPSTPIEETVEKVNKLTGTISKLYKSRLQETKIFEQAENILFDFRVQTPSEIMAAFKSEHNKADIKQRALLFFNILSMSTDFHKSFKITSALTEEYAQSSDSGLKEYFIKLMAQYLSSQRILFEEFTVENGKQLFSFCYSDLVRSDKTLRKACLLYLSRVINQNCQFITICKRYHANKFAEKYIEKEELESFIPLNNSDLLLAIEVLSNFRSPLSKEFIKKILLNKDIDAIVRTEAAWALSQFNDLIDSQSVFKPLVYDRSEHLEIRVTAFLSVLLSMPRALIPFLMSKSYDSKQGFYENKQFLSYAFDILKTFASAKFAMLSSYIRREIPKVYREVKHNCEELLGEKETSKYIYLVESKNFFRIIFHFPSTSSLIPQKIFVRTFDPYSDYTLKVSFQGYYNIDLFDIFDHKEPENKEVKEMMDAIVNKFRKQSSPSKRKFSMSLMTDDYYTHLIYSDEASNQLETLMKFPFSFEFLMRQELYTDSAFPYYIDAVHSRIQKVAASP
ncbi:hypothetical protein B4U79_16883, partial [Dinothrombium tinctorium]